VVTTVQKHERPLSPLLALASGSKRPRFRGEGIFSYFSILKIDIPVSTQLSLEGDSNARFPDGTGFLSQNRAGGMQHNGL